MSRWIGIKDDPIATGTRYDDLTAETPPKIPAPTLFVPVTTAQVEPGLNQLDRKDEIRGRRGDVAPRSFASAPVLTFGGRAYPKILRPLVRKLLSGSISSTGTSPKAIESTVGPIQSGSLLAFIGWLLREEQLDRVTGAIVRELSMSFPVDQEGSYVATCDALFHDSDATASADDPDGLAALTLPTPSYAGFEDTFMLRDASAFRGPGEGVEIADLAGFTVDFNNGMIEDFQTRFRPNHNIELAEIEGASHKLWYPERHKIGPQSVTGTIDLSNVDPDAEQRHLLTHAEKLVFEIAAGRLATTPAADEMMRLTIYQHAPTGGGADPLVREGDQRSTFQFSGYIDPATSLDFEATFVGAAALT